MPFFAPFGRMICLVSCALCNQAYDNTTGITRLKHNANVMETHNSPNAPARAMRFTQSFLKRNKIEWRHEIIALIIQKSRKRDKK